MCDLCKAIELAEAGELDRAIAMIGAMNLALDVKLQLNSDEVKANPELLEKIVNTKAQIIEVAVQITLLSGLGGLKVPKGATIH